MNRSIVMTILVVLGLAGGASYLIQRKHTTAAAVAERMEGAKAVTAPVITVTKVEEADFVEQASISGSLVPREEILVSPEVEGLRVLDVLVDEGQSVTKGQVLARLVAEQLEAQLAQNDAALARATAAIAQAQSQIAKAEAAQKEASAALARAEPLKKSGYLSGATYDQRESAAKTAEASVAAARDALIAAEAEKSQVEAQRRELSWRRGNTEVKAPEAGIVSRRTARMGAVASAAGEPMFRIIAKGEIELDGEIVETELARVKAGQRALITVPGAADVPGTVRLVSPEVDKNTRLGRVRVFLGANPALRVGAYARGHIETARSHGLSAPASAVTFEQSQGRVQIVVDNKVETRAVKTGLVMGDRVEILEGVKAGDLIVTRAGTFLRDGDVVQPVSPNATVSEVK